MTPPSSDEKAKKRLIHALADFIVTPGGIGLAMLFMFGSAATFKQEIMARVGLKPAVSDTVELSDEDQRTLRDVALKVDNTAKAVDSLRIAHDRLADNFNQFLLMQAAGRRLSDARTK